MPRRRLVASALVAIAATTACSSEPRLQFAADPSVSAWLAQSDIAPNQPLSFGAIVLCVSSQSTASITSVTIDHSRGDVRVEGFAVRLNPIPAGGSQLGGQKITLADFAAGFAPNDPQLVTGVCPKDVNAPTDAEAARVSELGVQVRLASGEIGGGAALTISYKIEGGAERTTTVPFGIWLCASTCPANIGESPGPST